MITFEGIELSNPEPFGATVQAGSKTLLQSGYYSVQVSPARPGEWSFNCMADSLTEVLNLIQQKGVLGRLIIDGVTYANVGIVGEIRYDPIGCVGNYAYSVSFTQSV